QCNETCTKADARRDGHGKQPHSVSHVSRGHARFFNRFAKVEKPVYKRTISRAGGMMSRMIRRAAAAITAVMFAQTLAIAPAGEQKPLSFVAFKRANANTLERSGKYLGMVVETVTYQVSGKVMTVTQNGTLNGNEVSSKQIFNKQ